MEDYQVSNRCVGCGGCHSLCPADAIRSDTVPFVIDSELCTGCGYCILACPLRAIIRISAFETTADIQ